MSVEEGPGVNLAETGKRRPLLTAESAWNVGLFVLAMALRLPALRWELPFMYHPDEGTYLERSLFLVKNGFDPVHYQVPGHVTIYLQFLVCGIYYLVGRLLGAFHSPEDFALSYFNDPSGPVYAGRLFESALSSLSVVLVFRIARRWFSLIPSLIAAVAYAANIEVVGQGTVIRTDSAMQVIILLSLLFSQKLMEERRTSFYAVQGLLLGIGFSAKFAACFALFPFLAAHAAGGKGWRGFFTRKLWLAAALVPAGILISGPYLLFHPGETMEGIRAMSSRLAGNDPGMRAPHPLGGWLYFLWDIFTTQGVPVLAAFFAGIFRMAARREDRPRLAVLLALPLSLYVLAIGPNPIHVPRFLLPAVPGLVLVTAFFLDLLWKSEAASWRNWGVAAAGAAVLSLPLCQTAEFLRARLQPATQTIAREWILKNLPRQEPILLFSYCGCPQLETRGQYQRKRYAPESVHRVQADFASKKSSAAKLLDRLLPSLFDLMYCQDWEYRDGLLATVRQRGIRYLILPFRAEPASYALHNASFNELMLAIGPELDLVKCFESQEGGSPVYIYRRR